MLKVDYLQYLKKLLDLTEKWADDDVSFPSIEEALAVAQFQFTVVQEIYRVSGED